jgi:hypothetical protein
MNIWIDTRDVLVEPRMIGQDADRKVDANRVPCRETLCAAALLLLIMAVLQYDVLFLGRSLITTDFYNPVDDRPLPQNYGKDFVPREEWTRRNLVPYANLRDAGATWWQWEPSTQFLKQAIHKREWPFWDPYIAGGTPAMANLIPAFFFPPYTAVVALGASVRLLNAYFLFLTWGASLLTFLFVRRHGVSFIAGLTGAVVVLMSGAVNQHLGTFFGQTAACLPLTLYATRLFLDLPNRSRSAGLAVAYATSALASFPPLLVAIFGVTALYALVAITAEPGLEGRGRLGMAWCLAVALSLGLVSFYYLPALAVRAATPQVTAIYRGAGMVTMPIRDVYQILSPTLMGGVQTYISSPLGPMGNPNLPFIPYVGLVPVTLALLVRRPVNSKGRTLLLASALSLVVLLLKLFGPSIIQWIGRLPFLGEIDMAYYFGIPVGFLVACLAALGVQAMFSGATSPTRALLVAIAIGGMTGSLWPLAERLGVFKSPSAAYWIRDWRVLAAITVLSATTILIAALIRHRLLARRITVTVVLGIVAAEGCFNGWYPHPKAWSIFDHPAPFVRVLQRTNPFDRLLSFNALHANLNSAFGIYSMDSMMAFNPPRAFELYRRYVQPAAGGQFMTEGRHIPPEAVLDRANIALLGMKSGDGGYAELVRDAEARGYVPDFDDGFVALFRRPTLPRFLYSSQYRVVPTAAALEAIADPHPRDIVLEEEPGFDVAPNAPGDPPVGVEAYNRNSLALVVDAPRPGLVYVADNFFDGWTAVVNGAPARILPANYAFRAVVVPPGRSRVEFRYWPPGLTTGLWITGTSVLTLLCLALVPGMRTTRVRDPSSTHPCSFGATTTQGELTRTGSAREDP